MGASRRRVHSRNLLVAGQLALALALLLVAGLVVRSALALQQLQLGFDHRQLLTLKTELPAARYPDDAQVRAFVAQLETRLRGLPGVEGVTTAAGRPVFEPGPSEPLVIEGIPWASEQARPLTLKTVVGAGYFKTLRIPILKGRALGAQLVSQRMREMGVRMALGASRSDVMRLVLGQGARLVLGGLALGLPVGLGLARVMAGALAGVSATDAVTFTLVPVLLGAVGLLAAAVPARRAARVEPNVVLRAE